MLYLQQNTDYYNTSFCHKLTEMQIQKNGRTSVVEINFRFGDIKTSQAKGKN